VINKEDLLMDFTDEQRELIDKYRDINTDHNWWDSTFDYWTEQLMEKGIDADDFAFSGFWSQGDGASFCGRINVAQFLKAHNLEQEYPAALFFAVGDEISGKLTRRGSHYSHENTVELTLYDDLLNSYDDDDLRCDVYESMANEYYGSELKSLEEAVISICRGYMRDIYRELEQEYEYLTSDSAVWETIEANELHLEVA
jgi:hypothetical protein